MNYKTLVARAGQPANDLPHSSEICYISPFKICEPTEHHHHYCDMFNTNGSDEDQPSEVTGKAWCESSTVPQL